MRSPIKRLGPILLASTVGLGGAVQMAHAKTHAASPITVTVAYQQFGPPPYWDQLWWQKTEQLISKQDPNITIKLEPIIASEGDYYTKVDLALRSASTTPDIVREDSFLVSSDVTAGYLQPLDSYLSSWPEYKQQWYPAMQTITQFNGHSYGIMNGTDDRLIYYNKNLFKQAGLPVSWQPKTWADILSAAQTIKQKVHNVIPMNMYTGIINDEESTMQSFEMLLYGTPDAAHLYDYKTKKWVISSTGIKDTLAFLQKIYNPSALLGPPSNIALNNQAATIVQQNLLPNGKLAMDFDGSWVPSTWYKTGAHPWPQWQSVLGVAKMPTEFGQGARYVTLSGGWAYSISARSKNKDAAFKALQVLNSKDMLSYYDSSAGQVTPRKDVADTTAYSSVPLNPYFTGMLSFTQFRPGYPVYPRISNEIDSAMQSVMEGTSPQAAMSTYAQKVTTIAGAGSVEKLK